MAQASRQNVAKVSQPISIWPNRREPRAFCRRAGNRRDAMNAEGDSQFAFSASIASLRSAWLLPLVAALPRCAVSPISNRQRAEVRKRVWIRVVRRLEALRYSRFGNLRYDFVNGPPARHLEMRFYVAGTKRWNSNAATNNSTKTRLISGVAPATASRSTSTIPASNPLTVRSVFRFPAPINGAHSRQKSESQRIKEQQSRLEELAAVDQRRQQNGHGQQVARPMTQRSARVFLARQVTGGR